MRDSIPLIFKSKDVKQFIFLYESRLRMYSSNTCPIGHTELAVTCCKRTVYNPSRPDFRVILTKIRGHLTNTVTQILCHHIS